jgi:(4S)-4-hydroxy-5-phosphonooxypentane-2,3-dione isomerase
MVLTCVHVYVKKEFVNDFIQATLKNCQETRKEKGNIRFEILQLDDFSQKFVLYEAFESEEAAAFHKTTPHYLIWRDTVQDWMEQPRQGIHYHVIEP